ncbi:MAG: domain S-box/diguanylate cyclase domain, partial [Capsulimonas sp.]|nr:domain S-box/diguanylate cyclase domain [Capsulimonas sp.]
SARYLTPFDDGLRLVPADLDRLQRLSRDNDAQQQYTMRLRPIVDAKLAELQQTVALNKSGNPQRALDIVNSGHGQQVMENIRAEISRMQAAQAQLLALQLGASESASRQTLQSVSSSLAVAIILLGVAACSVASLMRRTAKADEKIRSYNTILELQKGELERANGQLETLATTDGLTGLKNHRAFQERLSEEVSRAARYQTPLSLILLDVDRFKEYNDAHGHPAGDEVLKSVARILQNSARNTDFAARYGGEEFVLILHQTDMEGATEFAERLRVLVEGHPWLMRDVTASFGVACLQREDKGGRS